MNVVFVLYLSYYYNNNYVYLLRVKNEWGFFFRELKCCIIMIWWNIIKVNYIKFFIIIDMDL